VDSTLNLLGVALGLVDGTQASVGSTEAHKDSTLDLIEGTLRVVPEP